MAQMSEEKAAGKYGRKTRRSGGDPRDPGDVKFPHALVEDKVRSKDHYYLTKKVWEKLRKESKQTYKMSVFRVTVGDEFPIAVLRSMDWMELRRYLPEGTYQDRPGIRLSKRPDRSLKIDQELARWLDDTYPRPVILEWREEMVAVCWSEFSRVNNIYIEENDTEEERE